MGTWFFLFVLTWLVIGRTALAEVSAQPDRNGFARAPKALVLLQSWPPYVYEAHGNHEGAAVYRLRQILILAQIPFEVRLLPAGRMLRDFSMVSDTIVVTILDIDSMCRDANVIGYSSPQLDYRLYTLKRNLPVAEWSTLGRSPITILTPTTTVLPDGQLKSAAFRYLRMPRVELLARGLRFRRGEFVLADKATMDQIAITDPSDDIVIAKSNNVFSARLLLAFS